MVTRSQVEVVLGPSCGQIVESRLTEAGLVDLGDRMQGRWQAASNEAQDGLG